MLRCGIAGELGKFPHHSFCYASRNKCFLGADFTAKMESLIASEEIQAVEVTESQPLPQDVENLPFIALVRFMPMTQVAAAAGVCLVAVLGVQSFTANALQAQDTSSVTNIAF